MERTHGRRLTLLTLFVGVVSLLIGARLYQLQFVMSDRFRARADDQHSEREVVPAVRGSIVDRHGRELAASVAADSLFARPPMVADPEDAVARLAPVLGKSSRKLRGQLASKHRFVYLERFLEPECEEKIRKLGLPMDGYAPFGFEPGWKRVYPGGRLAVHVVGFANIDGEGVEGIEREFDDALQGDPAVYQVWQDGRQNGIRQLVRAPEKRPSDVVLSLDSVLQHTVERELARAVRETRARSGSAILLDPATGQVLALANWPAADLDTYREASSAARINRAVVHYYEPGSVFKVVTMAAALDRHRVTPGERFHCENGTYVHASRTIHDSSRHGWLTAREIVEKSSNIGMVKVMSRLSPAELRQSVLDFGFGQRTGIELPGETPGLVTSANAWNDYTQASVAFGHEITVSVVQMASAIAAVANDGVLVPPRVVLGTRDRDGRFTPRPAPEPRRVVSPETARTLTRMLEGVITEGTGTRAAVPGYRVAGKTGTAQMRDPKTGSYSGTDYMASFGGFGPVERPRLACLVVVERPRGDEYHGGQVAAPAFRRIMEDALRYLRVPSDRDTFAGSPHVLAAAFDPAAAREH